MPSKESLDRAARWYGYDNDDEYVGSTMRVKVDQLAAEFDAAKLEALRDVRKHSESYGEYDSKSYTGVYIEQGIAALERPAEGETKEKR